MVKPGTLELEAQIVLLAATAWVELITNTSQLPGRRFRFMLSWPRLWRRWGNSELLWGQLDIEPISGSHAEVQHWLAARRAALGRLRLHTYSATPGDTDALVFTLAGSTVAELDWKMEAVGNQDWALKRANINITHTDTRV
jgi:hypothetical protein